MAGGGGYPPIPPAKSPSPPPRHPLLEKCSFEQLHHNEFVETRPHILHFGGFQIHKEHSHVLRVLNISPSSLRISIIGPSTQHFRLRYDKRGLLAPGMSEDITVLFTPNEWRYHYDTVKIFCGDMAENLVVPIHGYPSANDVSLPRIIDFGRVAIGTARTKAIPLQCKVPLAFEYEISIVEAHPDFKVAPLQGVIPADGALDVSVTFTPTRHRTARAELLFNIAQFGFEPVTVSIVGSSSPDAAKQDVLRSVQSELAADASQQVQNSMADRTRRLHEKRGRGPVESRPPTFAFDVTERVVDGVKVPTTRIDKHATSFVLSQQPGKLPLKDLANFIKDQRDATEDRRHRANKSDASDDDDEPGEVSEEQRQARELRFEMRFREIEKKDREKELRSERATGEDVLDDAVVRAAEESRRRRHQRMREGRFELDTGRVESVLSTGPVAVPNSYVPPVKPAWDENANDTFSVRLQVIDRFIRAVSKCLMRTRATKRARLLTEALRANGIVDRESCRAWVALESKAAAVGGGSAAGADAGSSAAGGDEDDERLETVHIPLDFFLPPCLPTRSVQVMSEERQEKDVPALGDFKTFTAAPLIERLDYKVMNYERYSSALPPASSYMQLHADRPRLDAAREEHLVRGPCGEVDAAEVPLAMPESCLLPPAHDALSLLVPSVECRTYVALPRHTECDPEFWLAQPPPLIEPLKTEPLLPPDIMGLERPWLESWRQRRQIADPFQYCDPAPCSFAEAGGTLGPRLGCDMGGERLSFLPVGGLPRDVPSDTDDDDCGEFEMPPPGQEEYAKALEDMSGPLTSELWRKDRAAEDHLRSLCDANGRAVRERMSELNKDLHFSNKLFLG